MIPVSIIKFWIHKHQLITHLHCRACTVHIEVAIMNINVLVTNLPSIAILSHNNLSIGLLPTTVVDEDIMVPAITSGISNIT